jgi:hypothetical protein
LELDNPTSYLNTCLFYNAGRNTWWIGDKPPTKGVREQSMKKGPGVRNRRMMDDVLLRRRSFLDPAAINMEVDGELVGKWLYAGTWPPSKNNHLCLQPTDELEARCSQHHDNGGVSFVNVKGNEEGKLALNTNGNPVTKFLWASQYSKQKMALMMVHLTKRPPITTAYSTNSNLL